MHLKNKFILACAGSGKTTHLVDLALSNKDKKTLITTYTTENLQVISNMIKEKTIVIPENITIKSWYSLLLDECIRPYQNIIYNGGRVDNLFFTNKQSAPYERRENIKKYYFDKFGRIFSDKLSQFVIEINNNQNNLVINRLQNRFNNIFIDEAQDLAGYDFDFLKMIFRSNICIEMVGDPRQKTYDTTPSRKYKKYSTNIHSWFIEMEKEGNGELQILNQSYRCNQIICDFADKLFPDMPKTNSKNAIITDHHGIYIINSSQLQQYYSKYSPQILIYDRRFSRYSQGLPTANFGQSKGRTYERVLIVTTQPIIEYLKTNGESKIDSLCKFYVAITRAKHSVAFLIDNMSQFHKLKGLNYNNVKFVEFPCTLPTPLLSQSLQLSCQNEG